MTKAKVEKKVLKGLTLEDFMSNTNLSKPSKMVMSIDGIETDQHLLIVGAQSKQVTRARMIWGSETNELNKAIEEIPDGIDKAMRKLEGENAINNAFALELVVGWSFDGYKVTKVAKILSDNDGLSRAVIAHAFARETTLAKK